jgi:hypothetical protein
MYVKIVNNAVHTFPYSVKKLRQDNPYTSFPDVLTELDLSGYGVHCVAVSDKPSHSHNKKAARSSEPTLIGGVWTLGWEVRDFTVDELAAEAKAVRRDRDDLLVKSDWTQLADVHLSQEQQSTWTEYRLALRNITKQPTFPTLIDWPTSP